MKTAWDSYLDQQLSNLSVREAFKEETTVLSIGMQLANQRKRQGLTQAELAKKIGASTPPAQPHRTPAGNGEHAHPHPLRRGSRHES